MLKRIKGTVDKASGKKISGSKQPWYQPWEESGEQPTRQPKEESGEQPTRQPKEESGEQPTRQPKEESGEQPTRQPKEESGKQPTRQPKEKLKKTLSEVYMEQDLERFRKAERVEEMERQRKIGEKEKRKIKIQQAVELQNQEKMEIEAEKERERKWEKEEAFILNDTLYNLLSEFGYDVEPTSSHKNGSRTYIKAFKGKSEYFLALTTYKKGYSPTKAFINFKEELKLTEQASKEANFVLPICDKKFVRRIPDYSHLSAVYVFVHPPTINQLYYESNSKYKKRYSTAETLIQMALAVRNIHQNGIIQRNIKLNKFFRMRDGRIMLSSFMVAIKEEDTDIMDIETNNSYFVPHDTQKSFFGGEEEEAVTKKLDVFSLGMAMVEYLLGDTFTNCFLRLEGCFMTKSFGHDSFKTSELFDDLSRFYKLFKKYKLNPEDKRNKILELIFTRMLIKLDEGGFLGKSRISSEKVVNKLKKIFPKEFKSVERKYGDKTDHCSQEALE